MNTLSNQAQLAFTYENKGVRLMLGGCLLLALVCGCLYFAAQQKKQIPKPIQQQNTIEQKTLRQQTTPMPAQTLPPALAMKNVSLPAPPPLEATVKNESHKISKSVEKAVAKPTSRPNTMSVFKPKTKPISTPEVKPAGKPKSKNISQKPSKASEHTLSRATKVVDVSQHQSKTSEQLLQQVEVGKGPSIEINWPAQLNQRQALFSTLVDCLGVGLGVFVNGSVTPIHDSGRQYSRLVRMVGGKMVEREARLHRQSGINGVAVRLFPRHVDSRLLAGLASISSQPLSKYSQVQGEYVLSGGSLWVKNIYFDGTLSQGQILLARGACRR